MALITKEPKFVHPQAYFGVCHGHLPPLKLMSSTPGGMVDSWTKIDTETSVTRVHADKNQLELSNGKTYTYKALVLAPGFEHSSEHIKGLPEFEAQDPQNQVFGHVLDGKDRADRNYYNGMMNRHGDFICYSPGFPYKGEGSDFYALYYEHFLRQDKMQGEAAANSRIQFWTPNKEIFQFPYANEVALDECHKRDIDVMFGWELIELKSDNLGQKIAVFKNVDSGETIEKDFTTSAINPPSRPQQWLIDSGLTDESGLVDVNKYTLQHQRYENIFAFGDCVNFNTTRTMSAAMAQNPVIKNNVLNFLHGREVNGIYDGYSFMPMLLGHSYATNFQHLHDFEPATMNHYVPHHGIFSRVYFDRMLKGELGTVEKYGSFKKNHGPPYTHFAKEYDALEHNEFLKEHQIEPSEVRHPAAQARLDAGESQPAVVSGH